MDVKQLQMFFAERIIEVAGRNGIVSVSAEIIGQLAVHPALEDTQLWTISHVVSGYGVLDSIYDYIVAVAIAEQLSALDIDEYWKNSQCASQAFYDEAARLIKDVAARYSLKFAYRVTGKVCEAR